MTGGSLESHEGSYGKTLDKKHQFKSVQANIRDQNALHSHDQIDGTRNYNKVNREVDQRYLTNQDNCIQAEYPRKYILLVEYEKDALFQLFCHEPNLQDLCKFGSDC